MATRQYNVDKNATRVQDITELVGSPISSGVIEVTVDLAVPATKHEVTRSLDAIERYIRAHDWPPA